MNSISFAVQLSQYFANENQSVLVVVPVVDAVQFTELAARYESEKGFGAPGEYDGRFCSDDTYSEFSRFYLGVPTDEYYSGLDKLPLFSCAGCGGEACNSLYAGITTTDEEVIWSEFGHQHRTERDYDDFGPFRFRRIEYETCLSG